jgi:hypothetical protein
MRQLIKTVELFYGSFQIHMKNFEIVCIFTEIWFNKNKIFNAFCFRPKKLIIKIICMKKIKLV